MEKMDVVRNFISFGSYWITKIAQKKPLLQIYKSYTWVLQKKIPMPVIGIFIDVGHTGFEPVTSTLSR